MKSPFLRRFRILFSAIIFICFFVIFVDFTHLIPSKYINILLYLQFIPSLLKFIDLRTLASAGFAAVIILTFLTGRTFCSFLCPGSEQQNRRPHKEKIQKIWLQETIYNNQIHSSCRNSDSINHMGHLPGYPA
jgi:hypothetical protein